MLKQATRSKRLYDASARTIFYAVTIKYTTPRRCPVRPTILSSSHPGRDPAPSWRCSVTSTSASDTTSKAGSASCTSTAFASSATRVRRLDRRRRRGRRPPGTPGADTPGRHTGHPGGTARAAGPGRSVRASRSERYPGAAGHARTLALLPAPRGRPVPPAAGAARRAARAAYHTLRTSTYRTGWMYRVAVYCTVAASRRLWPL